MDQHDSREWTSADWNRQRSWQRPLTGAHRGFFLAKQVGLRISRWRIVALFCRRKEETGHSSLLVKDDTDVDGGVLKVTRDHNDCEGTALFSFGAARLFEGTSLTKHSGPRLLQLRFR